MYCYIFGALPVNTFYFNITDKDIVIAADSGIKNTQKFNISPDYIIGDFDSLGYKPDSENVLIYPVEKDDTDTLLAVKKALSMGYKSFRIFGCIGGRLDHTFANIQTAAFIAENGGNVVFYGNYENLTVIKDSEFEFTENNFGNISVFALTNCNNVNINGLFYELENGVLSPDFPLGVSNKFINKKASVSVKDGKLLILWESNNTNELTGEQNE